MAIIVLGALIMGGLVLAVLKNRLKNHTQRLDTLHMN